MVQTLRQGIEIAEVLSCQRDIVGPFLHRHVLKTMTVRRVNKLLQASRWLLAYYIYLRSHGYEAMFVLHVLMRLTMRLPGYRLEEIGWSCLCMSSHGPLVSSKSGSNDQNDKAQSMTISSTSRGSIYVYSSSSPTQVMSSLGL